MRHAYEQGPENRLTKKDYFDIDTVSAYAYNAVIDTVSMFCGITFYAYMVLEQGALSGKHDENSEPSGCKCYARMSICRHLAQTARGLLRP